MVSLTGFQAKMMPYSLQCSGISFTHTLTKPGDLVAFSRAYTRVSSDKKKYGLLETYTDTEHWLWKNEANGYEVVEGYPKKVAIAKIPVIYGYQQI